MKNELQRLKTLIDRGLDRYFRADVPQKTLLDAMRYSLLAGGKRIRGILVLKFCEMCGGEIERALPFACAVEMLHAYSLIHDDLPCMDNDDLRRGKPTNHIVYGECTATLAGDALQAAAFETMLSADVPAETAVRAAYELSCAAGEMGICGGQYLDMKGEGKKLSLEDVENIHRLKTASMIRAAARIGVILGGGSEEQLCAAEKFAGSVGLAFQIRDDMLDVISTTDELGKPVGSDKNSEKSTFVTLFGIEKCQQVVETETAKAEEYVNGAFSDTGFIVYLAETLAGRNS